MKTLYCGFVPDPHGEQTVPIEGYTVKGYWIVEKDLAGTGVLKDTVFEVQSNCAFDE